MVTNEFADASAELIKILSYLPKSEVEKIPLKLRDFFEKVANPNYITKIDPYKPLSKQNIKEKTKDLIAVIYRNYWCNEEERKELDKKLIENDKKYEAKLQEQYNPNNIFNRRDYEKNNNRDNQLAEYKEEKSFIRKLIEKIKNIFRKK